MAQVVINVDTDNKGVTVTIDGKELPNVTSISVYTEESGYFSFESCQYEKVGDLRQYTRLYANDKAQAAVEDGTGKQVGSLVQSPDKAPLEKQMTALLRGK